MDEKQQIKNLISSTRDVCIKIKNDNTNNENKSEFYKLAESYNLDSDLNKIINNIFNALSAEAKEKSNELLVEEFLSNNETYFQYFRKLLKRVVEIYQNYGLESIYETGNQNFDYTFSYPINIYGIPESDSKKATLRNDEEIVTILEKESIFLIKELISKSPYNNFVELKGVTFSEYIDVVIIYSNNIDNQIKNKSDNYQELVNKKNLIKQFYIDLCMQLQNFISSFIGKRFKNKITSKKIKSNNQTNLSNVENSEIPEQSSNVKDETSQSSNEYKEKYEIMSINCSEYGLKYIFKPMEKLKNIVPIDETRKSAADFNLKDFVNDKNEVDTTTANFFKYYYLENKGSNAENIKRQPGFKGVIPQLRYADSSKKTVKVIYDLENELPELKSEKLVKCPVENYPNCINNDKAVHIIEDVYHFSYDEDNSTKEKQIWLGTEITNASIIFEDDKGWSYKMGDFIVEEFDVASSYKEQPSTSTGVGKAFMNGHHGIPSEWAESEHHCKGFYNPDDAPVIMLRDTIDGSTHRFITTLQKMWDKFNDMKTVKWDYSEIRRVAMEQLYTVAEFLDFKKDFESYSVNTNSSNSVLVDVIEKTNPNKKNTPEKLQLSSGNIEKMKVEYVKKINVYFDAADKYYKGIYEKMLKGDEDTRTRAENVFGRYSWKTSK